MKTIVVLALLFLVAVNAHGGQHENKSSSKSSSHKSAESCTYNSTKGVLYNVNLLQSYLHSDLSYYDVQSQSTFYFSPCGTVSAYHSGINSCPTGSTVCQVTSNGRAINFGTNKVVQYADGVENHANFEATFGNGEQCDNGATRRTFVEYVCKMNAVETTTAIKNVTMLDDCTVKMIIESRYVCPVANYCASALDQESCETGNMDLCQWSSKHHVCRVSSGCSWGHYTAHMGGLLAIVLISAAGILLACTCGLCLCACRKRRRCNRRRVVKKVGTASRKGGNKNAAKKNLVKKEEKKNAPPTESYAPFQMPFQLVPGGFAPVNPYSNIQGYPMVNLAAPGTAADENEQV